jgi:hypothetical protein
LRCRLARVPLSPQRARPTRLFASLGQRRPSYRAPLSSRHTLLSPSSRAGGDARCSGSTRHRDSSSPPRRSATRPPALSYSQALRFCAPASRRVCLYRGTGVRAHAGTVATSVTRRITQLQYLSQLPAPISEYYVSRKFEGYFGQKRVALLSARFSCARGVYSDVPKELQRSSVGLALGSFSPWSASSHRSNRGGFYAREVAWVASSTCGRGSLCGPCARPSGSGRRPEPRYRSRKLMDSLSPGERTLPSG